MDREGPGFLADLAIFWLTLTACLLVLDAAIQWIGRPLGLLVGVATAVVIVFLVLLAYYRQFLDEQPIVGGTSRSRFALLAAQLFVVGFLVGALLAPPDPVTQVLLAALIVAISLPVSYWLVYRRNAATETGTGDH